MKKVNVCIICGLPEEDHHVFTPVEIPEGCVCDIGTWGDLNDIPPICDKFMGDKDDFCERCEHDKACHKE